MAKLKSLLDTLHESLYTSSADEIKRACALIIEVQAMGSDARDCIRAAYRSGPLEDRDVPSKIARDRLVESGYMANVVVAGAEGYTACTHKGAWAYLLLESGA